MSSFDGLINPPEGDVCAETNNQLRLFDKHIGNSSTPLDPKHLNKAFQKLARSLYSDRKKAPEIKCHTLAGSTLDKMARIRRTCKVSEFTEITNAENAAARCVLEATGSNGYPGCGLICACTLIDRAMALWSLLGDDTREHMIAHLADLGEYFAQDWMRFLEAADTFTDAIETRFEITGRPTSTLQQQTNLVIRSWHKMAIACGSAPLFRESFVRRARRLAVMIRSLDLLSSVGNSFDYFCIALRKLDLPRRDKPQEHGRGRELQDEWEGLVEQLADWSEDASRPHEQQLLGDLRNLIPYLRDRNLSSDRMQQVKGANTGLAVSGSNAKFKETTLTNVCVNSGRGVALIAPELERVGSPKEQTPCEGANHPWPVCQDELELASEKVTAAKLLVKIEFPTATGDKQVEGEADILRVEPNSKAPGSRVVCYLPQKAVEDPAWQRYVGRL